MAVSDRLGVYMSPDGPINVHEDMPREQMWFVLQQLAAELRSMRESHRKDWAFLNELNEAARAHRPTVRLPKSDGHYSIRLSREGPMHNASCRSGHFYYADGTNREILPEMIVEIRDGWL